MIKRFCDRCQSEIYEDALEVIQAKKGLIEQMRDAIKEFGEVLRGSPAKIPERPFPYKVYKEEVDEVTGNKHFVKEADLCDDCLRDFKEWFRKKDDEKLLSIIEEDKDHDGRKDE